MLNVRTESLGLFLWAHYLKIKRQWKNKDLSIFLAYSVLWKAANQKVISAVVYLHRGMKPINVQLLASVLYLKGLLQWNFLTG